MGVRAVRFPGFRDYELPARENGRTRSVRQGCLLFGGSASAYAKSNAHGRQNTRRGLQTRRAPIPCETVFKNPQAPPFQSFQSQPHTISNISGSPLKNTHSTFSPPNSSPPTPICLFEARCARQPRQAARLRNCKIFGHFYRPFGSVGCNKFMKHVLFRKSQRRKRLSHFSRPTTFGFTGQFQPSASQLLFASLE